MVLEPAVRYTDIIRLSVIKKGIQSYKKGRTVKYHRKLFLYLPNNIMVLTLKMLTNFNKKKTLSFYIGILLISMYYRLILARNIMTK